MALINIKTEVIRCACLSIEHHIVVEDDGEDLCVYVHLSNKSFFRRVLIAIKYIFGYKSRTGDYEEIMLLPEDYTKFYKVAKILEKKYENINNGKIYTGNN